MPLLAAHPTGNANARALASALAGAGLLDEFHTCLDYPADDRCLRWLPATLRREAARRRLPANVKPHARLHPARELIRLLGPRLGLSALTRRETGPCSVDGVYRALDRTVAARLPRRPALRGVYLYEDGAASAFAAARALGLRCFYDLPIGHWRAARRILGEEAELSPEWAATLQGLRDSPAKLARKDEELALADTVFVASSFTRSTLAGLPYTPADIVVAPYGAPSPPAGLTPARRAPGQPLRVLFVGSLGQRKGLRYLLDALAALGSGFELTLIGVPASARCDPLAAALRRHRHLPSLPHAEILAEMSRHHAFVFPSLFEGFGLVLLEAMACGLPLIATPHTAAPDILTEGREGFVVPIRDSAAIAEKLAWLAADEDRRQALSAAARARAGDFTWPAYGLALTQALRTRLAPARA
jgi:alpha-maltose-1-phosphate synthase